MNGVANPAFVYDANGNMLTGAGRTIEWNSFNMPRQVTRCPGNDPARCKTTSFLYSPEHERTVEQQTDGSTVITLSPRYDTGLHWEKRYLVDANQTRTGAIEYEHYLYAGGQMFGKFIRITRTDGVTVAQSRTEYYSKDHLGSIVAITDTTGTVTQRLSYDVWGKRRHPNGTPDPTGQLNNPDMYHGYTGHEMLDDVGLIHMNGRLYDPLLGRFVSADFLIQAPGNLQSYNRYSYVLNNPLGLTDPSGQSWWTDFRDAVIRVAAVVADGMGCNGFCSAAVGAYQGQRNGGGLQGALFGGIQGFVGYQMSLNFPIAGADGINWTNLAYNAGVNAAMGCAGAMASGGDCGRAAFVNGIGTVGQAYGLPGALIAGCAAGSISGTGCRQGARTAFRNWEIQAEVSAVQYMMDAAQLTLPR